MAIAPLAPGAPIEEQGASRVAGASSAAIVPYVVAPISDVLSTHALTRARSYAAAQELERRRIARELHDVVGQALTSALLSVDDVRRRLGPAGPDVGLEESREALAHAVDVVRTFALDLRPAVLDDLGLVAGLRWLVARSGRDAGYTAEFSSAPLVGRLDIVTETACYRVCQEALTNVARHAIAGRVEVTVTIAGRRLVLSVRDDGAGFDVDEAVRGVMRGESMGLATMSERVRYVGGLLELGSSPGAGAELRAWFPLVRSAPPLTVSVVP